MKTEEENALDPLIAEVIEMIDDDETFVRIVRDIPYGLDTEDVLLIARLMNACYPPTDPHDVAECLGDGVFTAILNPATNQLEWESDSTRFCEAAEWFEGDNAFGYRPPDRILVEAMTFDGTLIRHVENPTEEMKLAAVRRTSAAIVYIKNPSEAVRRTAAATATAERPQARAALSKMNGSGTVPAKAMVDNATQCRANHGCGINAGQDEPTYFVQGIGPLNLFSDLLICTVMELNSHIGNNERAADFVHMSEIDGGLVFSFATMRRLFFLRDVFRDVVAMRGIEGDPEMAFDGMDVIAYPSAMGPGFVTWGAAAAVARMEANLALH